MTWVEIVYKIYNMTNTGILFNTKSVDLYGSEQVSLYRHAIFPSEIWQINTGEHYICKVYLM